MSQTNDTNESGLERLLVDEDDRPDEIEIDDTTIDTAEFHDRLETIADVAESIGTLATDLRALRSTGLDDSDVVDLLYGRSNGLTKTTIETVMSTLDDVDDQVDRPGRSGRRDLLVRLVADLGKTGKTETTEVFDELERLHSKYGSDE